MPLTSVRRVRITRAVECRTGSRHARREWRAGSRGLSGEGVEPDSCLCARAGRAGDRASVWGGGDFPPTSLQVSNLDAGTDAALIIPSPAASKTCVRTEAIPQRHGLGYAPDWSLSGEPFLTRTAVGCAKL